MQTMFEYERPDVIEKAIQNTLKSKAFRNTLKPKAFDAENFVPGTSTRTIFYVTGVRYLLFKLDAFVLQFFGQHRGVLVQHGFVECPVNEHVQFASQFFGVLYQTGVPVTFEVIRVRAQKAFGVHGVWKRVKNVCRTDSENSVYVKIKKNIHKKLPEFRIG